MHRTAFARPQRRSRSGRCRTGTLENRLSRNRTARRRPALCRRLRALLLGRRRLIDRTRAGLRHDHAPQRSRRSGMRRCRLDWLRLHGRWLDSCRWRRNRRLRRRNRHCRTYRRRNHNLGRRRKNWNFLGGRGCRRRSLRHRRRCGRNHRRRYHRALHRRCRRRNRSRGGLGRDRWSRRRGRTGRRYWGRARRNLKRTCCRTGGGGMRLLLDRLQHVAGLGDV